MILDNLITVYPILCKTQEIASTILQSLQLLHSSRQLPNPKIQMSEIPTRDEYMTVKDVQESLGVSAAFVHRLIQAGKLPALRLSTGNGRAHVRIKKTDYLKWIEENQTMPSK